MTPAWNGEVWRVIAMVELPGRRLQVRF